MKYAVTIVGEGLDGAVVTVLPAAPFRPKQKPPNNDVQVALSLLAEQQARTDRLRQEYAAIRRERERQWWNPFA